MGFAELDALQGKLTSLNESLSSYSIKLDNQINRKEKLESLINDMKSVCNRNSDDVTEHINKIISNLEDALKGVSSVTEMETDAKADKEKDIFEDTKMNSALIQLESELSDVTKKITDYETKISAKKTEIGNCRMAIRSEQRNIATNYKNRYNNAQWNYDKARAECEKEPTSERLRINCDVARRTRNIARDDYNRYSSWL